MSIAIATVMKQIEPQRIIPDWQGVAQPIKKDDAVMQRSDDSR